MKNSFLFVLCAFMAMPSIYPQETTSNTEQRKGIYTLVDTYAQAREKKDTILLESILATNVDQLVSSGKWRG